MSELERLIQELRTRIHRGQLVPGQRLIEADLVAETGMSRGRIREALRRLEDERLVRIDRNRGASVRRISRKEVSDTLEVLRALSLLMTENALAKHDSPEARRALGDALEQVRRFRHHLSDFEQSRQFMDENARFWDVFANLSDNPVLTETRIRLETTLFRLALEGTRITSEKDLWIARHEEILEAILAGDRNTAIKLVKQSVLDVERAILALPDSAFTNFVGQDC